MGNAITAIGATGFTAVGAVQGFLEGTTDNILTKGAALFGGGGLRGAALGASKPWFEVAGNAFKTLFFFGIVCATYIPLIPAIVWIMRLVSIFAIWVEAVVSAPVWAFAHLDTDGEGMGNRSGHGYLFILNVLLNPMLSVLGLVLGTVLLDIMSLFVLELYPDMISNAAGDSWTGLIKIIALLMIFVMINLSLVNLCMQLINVIPDNVMDWIGSRLTGGSLGKNGEDMVSGGAKGSLVGANWLNSGKKKEGAPTNIMPNLDGGSSIVEMNPRKLN
jgi:conjugal transfer/type IV secretion protein DotA/TraY